MNDGSLVGLFAGIGGIELGLHARGFQTELLCEIDPGARAVLEHRFPGIEVARDVRGLSTIPRAEVLAAGFPCQDLSQAGRTAGIAGAQSSLVGEVFRLLRKPRSAPRWLLLENVPFMLQLDAGRAMRFLVHELEALGYTWAYRIVDARAFGLPQRRQRVLLLASKSEDPRPVLFQGNEPEPQPPNERAVACGFYWTEGNKGLGWAVDAVPTLKGGSTVGIPSPPAIRLPGDRGIVTPEIRDAERLQGFPADWTRPAVDAGRVRQGGRWRLVGNAVSVPVANWLGQCLRHPKPYDASGEEPFGPAMRWPRAAWGHRGKAFAVPRSAWPTLEPYQHLSEFLAWPTVPLSARAASGFLTRTATSTLRFPAGLLDSVKRHLRRMDRQETLV